MPTIQGLLQTTKIPHFNGKNNYVEVPDYSPLRINPPVAFELMFKLIEEEQKYGVFFRRYTYIDSITKGIRFDTGYGNAYRIQWGDGSTHRVEQTDIHIDLSWKHVVLQHHGEENNNLIELYENGNKIWEYQGIPLADPVYDLRIGGVESIHGYIALVRIYNRVLTEDEVLWNYYHLNDPVLDGLVLWLHWDSIDWGSGVWRDRSRYGNHGTIYGCRPYPVLVAELIP